MTQLVTFRNSFQYVTPTSVIAVISAVGPTTGGAPVLVVGFEFRYGATVTFGGVAATSVVVLNENYLTCIPPAHAVGAVDVVVTNPTGLYPSGTLVGGYTYAVQAPTVTAISPTSGDAAGGEAVIITGTRFVATPTVKFGATSATSVVFIDSNTISCITPAHTQALTDVTVTNPDTQFGTLFNAFQFLTVPPFADTGGWWWSAQGLAGGTNIIVTPGVPKHPRLWSKLSPFVTAGANIAEGGFPAASVIFRNHIIYAGDDYTLGTTNPSIRIFDGISDRLMTRLPNTASGAVPRSIVSMLLVGDIIYVTTFDSGTTSANFAGRVFSFDPLSQTLTPIGAGFSGGEVPYALAWHMDRLWMGTNKGNGTPGNIYFHRPYIDTGWTTDYTLTTSTVGGATSLLSYNGLLYVGTDNVNGVFAKVLVRSTTGVYTDSLVATGGTAKVNNGFYSLIKFGTNLYATYWNADATAIAKIYKFDNATWTTPFSGAALTLRPYMLTFLANNFLYVAGGGVGKRASLIRSADGTTWVDLSAYLAGPVSETALPLYGVVGS